MTVGESGARRPWRQDAHPRPDKESWKVMKRVVAGLDSEPGCGKRYNWFDRRGMHGLEEGRVGLRAQRVTSG